MAQGGDDLEDEIKTLRAGQKATREDIRGRDRDRNAPPHEAGRPGEALRARRLRGAQCAFMKTITLEKVRDALALDQHAVVVPEATAARARAALERMVSLG
jgi:hypothetical protein